MHPEKDLRHLAGERFHEVFESRKSNLQNDLRRLFRKKPEILLRLQYISLDGIRPEDEYWVVRWRKMSKVRR
jgi:hypothetical protein